MIINQQLICDRNDAKDTVVLRNTVDCRDAIDLVQNANLSGGGRVEGGMVCIGHIPPEYWQFDPWLLQARKAQRGGDRGEYQKNVMKFFELHPAFKIVTPGKYYQGVSLA